MMRLTPPRCLPRRTTTTPTITPLRITTPSHHLPRISRPYSTPPRPLLTLAIETSCDDTCVAVLEKSGPAARLLFNKKVTSDHRRFGGVHPAAAVVGHDAALATLVQEAIQCLPEATTPSSPDTPIVHTRDPSTGHPTARRPPDFVTATRGPGMSANLSVGLNTAKGLACAWNVPLLGVHHMQAHALTPRLVSALALPFPSTTTTTSPDTPPSPPSPPSPSFPFLTLLISGGHTLLLHSHSLTSHSLLATTPSHAIGNMLDAASRLILPPSLLAASPTTNYAAALETFAFPTPDYTTYTPPPTRAAEIAPYVSTTGGGWHLTPPLSQSRRMEFNFTGLGSQVAPALRSVSDDDEAGRRELAFAVQKVAFEQLASRVVFALDELNPHPASARYAAQGSAPKVGTLVVAGGVASNGFLRRVIRGVMDARGHGGVEVVCPPVGLCTDNAAMVGWAGMEMYEAGWRSGMEVLVKREWGMGGEEGVLGVGGWWNVDGRVVDGTGEVERWKQVLEAQRRRGVVRDVKAEGGSV